MYNPFKLSMLLSHVGDDGVIETSAALRCRDSVPSPSIFRSADTLFRKERWGEGDFK